METNDKNRLFNGQSEEENRLQEIKNAAPDNSLLYEDPAITNPKELATFPKPAPKMDATEVEEESETRLQSLKRSPVRDGRNIIRTDTIADTDGFM